MAIYSIDGLVNHTILLGSGYAGTFLVGSPNGVVRPQDNNALVNYTGIASFLQNASLTNDGFIYGSNELAHTGGRGTAGGTAVNFALAGDHFYSDGGIRGGAGGNGVAASGYGFAGGAGGTGVNLVNSGAVSTNNGFIIGGVGGSGSLGYGGGTGGTGLSLSAGTLKNAGTISGGVGGANTDQPGTGATGGTGANIGSGGTLNVTGGIVGGGGAGAGYFGGQGGIGVDLTSGATLTDAATVKGGNGTHSNINQPSGVGGAGGAGLVMANGATATIAAAGAVDGGNAGYGYSGGVGGIGIDMTGGASLTISGLVAGGTGGYSRNDYFKYAANAGAGGAGVYLRAGGTAQLNSSAVIVGGTGGAIVLDTGVGKPGSGGAGMEVGTAAVLTNFAQIIGGLGGTDNLSPLDTTPAQRAGGVGGTGVELTQDIFFNRGSILGGLGGQSKYGYYGGAGGSGVYLNGGTLTNFGDIEGGMGGQGDGPSGEEYLTKYDHRGALGSSVDFGPKSATLVIESTATFTGAITDFAVGDKIDITNMNVIAVLQGLNQDDGSATISTATSGTLTISEAPADEFYRFTAVIDGNGADIILVACYLRGTRIATREGERPIETLQIGDRVMTRAGVLRPIRWIGRRRYSPETVFGNRDLAPVLLRAGALSENVPRRDLWVSPEHAMYVDGALFPARALVNGLSIVQDTAARELRYYHIEFETHDVIIAEGAFSESFVDDESRAMFDNGAEYSRLYPDSPAVPAVFCAPRIEEGATLEAVRGRLRRRAQSLFPIAEEATVLPGHRRVAKSVAAVLGTR